jgi:predicted membrane protein
MEVLLLTIFLSFSLAVFFLFLFIRTLKSDYQKSPEQSALIPFQDDEAEFTDSKPSEGTPKK